MRYSRIDPFRGQDFARKRLAMGNTVTKLAKRMGVKPATVRSAEKGSKVDEQYGIDLESLYDLHWRLRRYYSSGE